MNALMLKAMSDEFTQLTKVAAKEVPWRKAFAEGSVELLPGVTAGLGGILAAKYDKPVSVGAALGSSVGTLPWLLRGKG